MKRVWSETLIKKIEFNLFLLLFVSLLSASIHQISQAQLHPQSSDHRRHGDQTEETRGGRAERAGCRRRRQLGTDGNTHNRQNPVFGLDEKYSSPAENTVKDWLLRPEWIFFVQDRSFETQGPAPTNHLVNLLWIFNFPALNKWTFNKIRFAVGCSCS